MGDFVTGLTPNWVMVLMDLLPLLVGFDLLQEALSWARKRRR